MPPHRSNRQSRRLTTAGLIAVSAATLLMMAWAIFPTAASRAVAPSRTPSGPVTMSTPGGPGGTAFTGVENVVPMGAVALLLMSTGSGLLWAGARRRRQDSKNDE